MGLDLIKQNIRDIPDFPKPGIVFKDISPVLQDAKTFQLTIDLMADALAGKNPDILIAIDARGFLFGAALAYKIGCGLSLVRKKGKLPYKTIGTSYQLEYGSNEVEMHADALEEGTRVVIVDDVLATGGTAKAAADLVTKLGGEIIAMLFFMELSFLNGRQALAPHPVNSLIQV